MSKFLAAVQKLGPLRHVITEGINEHGVETETLECGHTIHRKKDIAGPTNAYRRRCRHCRDGERAGTSSIDLTSLSDVPMGPDRPSPRLAAVITRLPKTTRIRTSNALCNARVCTLSGLCMKKRSDMHRMKEIGRKVVTDLETVLASFKLTFAEAVRSEREKSQTPGQRVANPVWLREQLHALITDCDENIAEDQDRADKERDDMRRARYEASVDCHRHWKRQLERILTGKTSLEGMAELLAKTGTS